MSPFAVEMWSVPISIPSSSLIQGCICKGLASLPKWAKARRTASCLLIFSAMWGSRWGDKVDALPLIYPTCHDRDAIALPLTSPVGSGRPSHPALAEQADPWDNERERRPFAVAHSHPGDEHGPKEDHASRPRLPARPEQGPPPQGGPRRPGLHPGSLPAHRP